MRMIKLKHPIQGLVIAKVKDKGTDSEGRLYTDLNLGTCRVRMIGDFPHQDIDPNGEAAKDFGIRRKQAPTVLPYVEPEQRVYIEDDTFSSNVCLCGCGERVVKVFKAGHDARLKSLLNKVLKGEANISEIPEGVKEYIERKESWSKKYGTLFQ